MSPSRNKQVSMIGERYLGFIDVSNADERQ